MFSAAFFYHVHRMGFTKKGVGNRNTKIVRIKFIIDLYFYVYKIPNFSVL